MIASARVAQGLKLLAVLLVLAISPSTNQAQQSQTSACLDNGECVQKAYQKSIDAARNGRYIEASFGLLADLGVKMPDGIRDPDAFDQFSQVWSAMTGAPAANGSKAPARHVAPDEIAALEAAHARPAIAEIVARAKRTRVVMLDEDHLVPRDRAFGLEVARALRPLGYGVLALEALKRDKEDSVSLGRTEQLSKEGYVRRSSGYYLNDPVFADFLRQAMAMGYHLVSYESGGFTEETTAEAAFARREQEQAENIVRRALTRYPNAKVLIYGGHHHAAKSPIASDTASDVKGHLYMMARLRQLTGIDPLVIDQFDLGAMPTDRPDVDLYAVVSQKAMTESVILTRDSQPLVVGLLAGAADLQVVHPPVKLVQNRPAWLERMGRKPVAIPDSLLPTSGSRLIQAFLASEPDDAIPIDQVLVTAGQPVPGLMLPKARVRYAYQ